MEIGDTDTVERMVVDLIEAINRVILQDDVSGEILTLDPAVVIAKMHRDHEGLDTSLALTPKRIAHATDALITFVQIRFQLFAPLRAGELDLDKVGEAMINMAIADMELTETPLSVLRREKAQKRLETMLVCFAVACLDPAIQVEHDHDGILIEDPSDDASSRESSWFVHAGTILGTPVLRGMYVQALTDHGNVPGFESMLRSVIEEVNGYMMESDLDWAISEARLRLELTAHPTAARNLIRFTKNHQPRGES